MSLLVIQKGKHKGTRLVLPKRHVVIGRDENCGIRLNSSEVSRQHCRLRLEDSGYSVEDLSSQNGTFVNDRPVEGRVTLKDGDLLRVGPMEFVFTDEEQAAKKAKHRKKAPRKKGKTVTSDEIANWLTEDDGADSADSTVILPRSEPAPLPGTNPEQQPDTAATGVAETADSHPASDKGGTDAAGRRGFASVAEEGDDIIRRYLEKVGQSPPASE